MGFDFHISGDRARFPTPSLAMNMLLCTAASYHLPRPITQNPYQTLGAADVQSILEQSHEDWRNDFRTRRFDRFDHALDAAFHKVKKTHVPARGLVQRLFVGEGLEMVFFRGKPNILAIAGYDDMGTFLQATKYMGHIPKRQTALSKRLQKAISFAQDLANDGHDFWLTGHSTGAVEGSLIYLEMLKTQTQGKLQGAMFFNPLNNALLAQAAQKARKIKPGIRNAPPLFLMTSQPPNLENPKKFWRYRFDMERLVTGTFRPSLPRTTATLHFTDPSLHPTSGHRLSTTCRALAAYSLRRH